MLKESHSIASQEFKISHLDWLIIDDDHQIQINLRLNPKVVRQIEQDIKELNTRPIADRKIIYRLDKQKLLKVLGSSVGVAAPSQVKPAQGTIVIWTFYDDNPDKKLNVSSQPILRTVMYIDGDMTQKVHKSFLANPEADRILEAHSFAIAQISRQLISAIADYLQELIRPWAIATISSVATYTWGKSLLPKPLWIWSIAVFLGVLAIFLISSKLKSKLQSSSLKSPTFTQKLNFKFSRRLGRLIRKIFDNPLCQIGAIAILLSAIIGLILTESKLTIAHPLISIIHSINLRTEPYLPLAIVSARKMIVSIFTMLFPSVIQLIFKLIIK